MKHCDAIQLELAAEGPTFMGAQWPAEITVKRELVEYPQGPHVQFGRRGTLSFLAVNGQAVYRRFEDAIGGWVYKLVDSNLKGAVAPAPVAAKQAEPMAKAGATYRQKGTPFIVEAFQWLPHAVPPVTLPDWFVRADFEQKADGALTIRRIGAPPLQVQVADWIVKPVVPSGGVIGGFKPARFVDDFEAA
jgi:hypothetical protein